ncbi:MAG: protease inhibitor I42 family protein, partial [Acidobacteriaceae bacterium]|nr:protease inhibitor I42 family protein [Acidobacteriaceae bacterium]
MSDTNSGRLIYLQPGQTLEVRLHTNPRNDFTWSVMPVSRAVLRQDNRLSAPGTDPHGGGLDLWRFTATERGRQTLRFEYRR